MLEMDRALDRIRCMTSIKGHFDGQAVVLDEPLPLGLTVGQQVRVVVDAPAGKNETPRRERFGFAKGMFEMRDDFNAPLDDFADYR
jgi:hypothetical protein